jgi:hypothetical protein
MREALEPIKVKLGIKPEDLQITVIVDYFVLTC